MRCHHFELPAGAREFPAEASAAAVTEVPPADTVLDTGNHFGHAVQVRGRSLSMSVTVLGAVALLGCRSSSGDGSVEVARGTCARQDLPGVDLPAGIAPTNVGYFAECDVQAASTDAPLGTPFRPIEIYDDPAGSKVIAWWYWDCGLAEGIVAPGSARPDCAPDTSATVGAATP